MKGTTTTSLDIVNETRLQQACSSGPTPETISMHELVDQLDEFIVQIHKSTEYQFMIDVVVH